MVVSVDSNITSNSTDKIDLQYVTKDQVKMDGGCSFFTFDTTDLKKGKYILLIDRFRMAYIQYAGNVVPLKHVSRTLIKEGYKDYFKSYNHSILLDLKKSETINSHSSIFSAEMTLTVQKHTIKIPIHGLNEDYQMNKN